TRSSLRSISSRRRKIRERLSAEVMDQRIEDTRRMRPQPPLLARASVGRPSAVCVGEWQGVFSFPHPLAEHPLVALGPPHGLFICAKDLFIEATHALLLAWLLAPACVTNDLQLGALPHGIASCTWTVSAVVGPVGAVGWRGGHGDVVDIPRK